jgi:hypothetical protein
VNFDDVLTIQVVKVEPQEAIEQQEKETTNQARPKWDDIDEA